jgi:hypothetical protein
MTIATISVANEWNPAEVQAWLDAHPAAVIKFVESHDTLMYIFYE